MPQIKILDEGIINKIAAGEVIDRPASIVKELIENSLDASAKEIKIDIESGGIKLIRITDNGKGISKEDLPLAPLRHSTSKINAFEDIYKISSMGFRGEALASICHIAELEIISKTENAVSAFSITAENGKISNPLPQAHPIGTSIIVKDIFAKIPVRQKYLKSPSTELTYINNIVMQFALLFPEIDFILNSEKQEILNTSGISDSKLLSIHFFGKELKDKLIKVDQTLNGIQVKGWVSDPHLTYPNRTKQFFSINNRSIKSPILQRIIANTYRDLIPGKRFPFILLNLNIATDTIDINIHPKKEEVKFLSPDLIFSTLPKILKHQFNNPHKSLNDFNKSIDPNKSVSDKPTVLYFQDPENLTKIQSQELFLFDKTAISQQTQENIEYFHIFNSYIIVKGTDSLWILDQHAVHERILFEQFKQSEKENNIIQQSLLISEVVTLSPNQTNAFNQTKDFLKKILFDIEDFGGNQIIARKIPALLTNCNIQEWLLSFLDETTIQPEKTTEATLTKQEELQIKACKAAIKAGKKLNPQEVKQLLQDFINSEANYTCPHGRPLFVKYTKENLEKLFKRR